MVNTRAKRRGECGVHRVFLATQLPGAKSFEWVKASYGPQKRSVVRDKSAMVAGWQGGGVAHKTQHARSRGVRWGVGGGRCAGRYARGLRGLRSSQFAVIVPVFRIM